MHYSTPRMQTAKCDANTTGRYASVLYRQLTIYDPLSSVNSKAPSSIFWATSFLQCPVAAFVTSLFPFGIC